MTLIVCGLNHQTAPLAVREKVVYLPEQVGLSLYDLAHGASIEEAAIISTCNRTEWYCIAPNATPVVNWLKQKHADSVDIGPYLYCYQSEQAVRHLLRVASGLDSMVVGEPQILGQIKAAFKIACQAGTIGSYLHHLFQTVFRVTKQVRTHTAIGTHPVSIASTAVRLAKQIFADISKRNALLIGAGATVELAAKHLHEQGIGKLLFINRTLAKAEYLAQHYQGIAYPLSELPSQLSTADILISATSSTLPLLGKGSVESAIKIRKHQPMLMLDLAVPRDIEAEVAQLADVYLYTLDDLQATIAKSKHGRQTAALQAEQIIDLQTVNFMRDLHSRKATATIRAYRNKIKDLANEEINKALSLLERGNDPKQIIQMLAYALGNKFLHMPSVQLRQAAGEGRTDLLTLAQQLFDLAE
jgi:glutamyl-tRNA reductase